MVICRNLEGQEGLPWSLSSDPLSSSPEAEQGATSKCSAGGRQCAVGCGVTPARPRSSPSFHPLELPWATADVLPLPYGPSAGREQNDLERSGAHSREDFVLVL